MNVVDLLITIIVVTILVTIVLAIATYVAYKLRLARHPAANGDENGLRYFVRFEPPRASQTPSGSSAGVGAPEAGRPPASDGAKGGAAAAS